LLYILNGVLRSLGLKIRAGLQLVRCVRFHSSLRWAVRNVGASAGPIGQTREIEEGHYVS
jgi:hypothetical protein